MQDFIQWLKSQSAVNEADTRYSVEVNFRTEIDEVLTSYAKICLGYVSAGLKRKDFHVKQVFEEKPLRILVSSRNWDDGEWTCVVSWNPTKHCYVISTGFYNKERRTISVQTTKDSKSDSAAEIVREVIDVMHGLKNKPDRHVPKMKRAALKRGPK